MNLNVWEKLVAEKNELNVRKFLEIFIPFPLHHVIEKGVGIASNKVCLNQKDLRK